MYLIVGLGNPEPEYSKTRHNMGFDVINKLSKKYDIKVEKKDFEGLYGMGEIEGEKVILLKPQTYMNESGKSIIKCKNFYKIPIENVIVIYDDIDIEEGITKIRKTGGAGTHNGMKSVISELNEKGFTRVRVGTGMPEFKELLIPYVLEKLKQDQYKKLEPAIDKAAEAIPSIIVDGVDKAMNLFN